MSAAELRHARHQIPRVIQHRHDAGQHRHELPLLLGHVAAREQAPYRRVEREQTLVEQLSRLAEYRLAAEPALPDQDPLTIVHRSGLPSCTGRMRPADWVIGSRRPIAVPNARAMIGAPLTPESPPDHLR